MECRSAFLIVPCAALLTGEESCCARLCALLPCVVKASVFKLEVTNPWQLSLEESQGLWQWEQQTHPCAWQCSHLKDEDHDSQQGKTLN